MEMMVALLIGCSAGFAVYLLFASRLFPSYRKIEKPPDSSVDANVSDRMAAAASFVSNMLPLSRAQERNLRNQIAAAGFNMKPSTFYGLSVILSLLGMIALLVFSPYIVGSDTTSLLLFNAVVVAAGILGPRGFLILKRNERQEAINRELASVIDLLSISVEAGLTMERAMRHVSERLDGTLCKEIALCERDINLLGYSREDALRRLADRCQTEGVSMFVSSVIVSAKSGSSISRVLKMQASVARNRQFTALEEKVEKLPTKMIFPMSMFIMPSLMLIVMAPAVLTLVESFSGMNL